MARSRRRNLRRRRRPQRRNTSFQQFDGIIKGVIDVNSQVDVALNDFAFKGYSTTFQLISSKVTLVSSKIADVYIAYYTSTSRNDNLRNINVTVSNQVKTFFYRWPPRMYVSATEAAQTAVQIYNCAINQDSSATTDSQIVYSCQLTVRTPRDVFDSTVDPPHLRKNGRPTSLDTLAM